MGARTAAAFHGVLLPIIGAVEKAGGRAYLEGLRILSARLNRSRRLPEQLTHPLAITVGFLERMASPVLGGVNDTVLHEHAQIGGEQR